MKLRSHSLATILVLAISAGGLACSPESSDGGGSGGTSGSTGGSGGRGGTAGTAGSGGSTGGRGGASASGGTGGSAGGSSGSGGSTGGSSGSGGSGGSAGGSGGSSGSGGATGGTSGSGGSGVDMGAADKSGDVGGGSEAGSAGKLVLTVTGFTMGPNGRNCYAPASNDNGNHSPKLDWTVPPPGTMSLVLSVEDQSSSPSVHQIVCNIPPTVLGRPADVKGMIPEGAQAGYGHNKTAWYGPGAGNVRPYEIRIWALATPTLEGGCTGIGAAPRAALAKLKAAKDNKAIVLDSDGKIFWGNAAGACN